MKALSHPEPNGYVLNGYVLNSESDAELARLMRQDHQLTLGMGGIFPENPDLTNVQKIIDLACGPGGWALDVGFTYSDIEVMGVDLSRQMIAYANAQAKVLQRTNVNFQVVNVFKPLPFLNASFDLVNIRLIAACMNRAQWLPFLSECVRILRPGGLLRVTEIEWGQATKPYFEEACHRILLAMSRLGYTFSPTGYHYGVISALPSLFRQTGVEQIEKLSHVIEYSSGTAALESFFMNYSLAFPAIESLLVRAQVATSEEWRDLYSKALAEMYSEDFCAMWILLTVWGYKP